MSADPDELLSDHSPFSLTGSSPFPAFEADANHNLLAVVYVYRADPSCSDVQISAPDVGEPWQQDTVLVIVRPDGAARRISAMSRDPLDIILGETDRRSVRHRLSDPLSALRN